MEREVMFRGLTTDYDNNGFVYGSLAVMNKNKDFFIIPIGMTTGSLGFYKVTPESVGEFTGLKDKNGNPIYEGDILSIQEDMQGHLIDVMVWDNEFQFHIKNNFDNSQSDFDQYDAEIIGNIHQNPELLK